MESIMLRFDISSTWKQLYVAALLEPNRAFLLDRVHAAEVSILDHVEHFHGRRSVSERKALDHALKNLHDLQEHCLSLPRSGNN
jgi:hypothetical protein